MRKIIRAGILSLAIALVFMFTAALVEDAASGRYSPPAEKGRIFTQGIQEKHNYYSDQSPFIHLSKHSLTLQKGKSEKLTVTLLPGGKPVSVTWTSSNPKIAKVYSSGKVTAVAPGIAAIHIFSEEYYDHYALHDGFSSFCYVTVPGGPKDAKTFGKSDRNFCYGTTKLTAPTSDFSQTLANIKKSIGGIYYTYEESEHLNLIFGSDEIETAHTYMYIWEEEMAFGFRARGKSPIKTSRGIKIGTKKSTVQQKYGLPTYSGQYTEDGKTYEYLHYQTNTIEKVRYMYMQFDFLKPKDTVTRIRFYIGE